MELKIKTLKGSCVLLIDLKDTKTVGQLQALLHQQHKGDPLDIPQPEHQRLVCAVCDAAAATDSNGGLSLRFGHSQSLCSNVRH